MKEACRAADMTEGGVTATLVRDAPVIEERWGEMTNPPGQAAG